MKDPHRIIVGPLITEKGKRLKDENNQYCFKVDRRANKIEIGKAVEELFGVHVLEVRTINVPSKPKRLGRYEGRRPGWKKAIVTLADGETIEIFEGV
ncbi:MAG TPA: 50S ribosomal protein L23 [Candidatus Latescibacteria bacterium]|nr:50S ribosomal protein L23 [Candidatus Latescibacterota bacterium]